MYKNLKALRKNNKLSQAKFAEEIGIPTNTYNNYENQVREPNSSFWVTVAEKYKVSIDYLMGFCDDPQSTKYAVTFPVSPEEKTLVRSWRTADDNNRQIAALALGFEYEKEKTGKKDAS